MSNPFDDIIQQHDDHSKVTMRRVGGRFMAPLGIDTEASPLGSMTSPLAYDLLPKSGTLESDVNALVAQLRALIGEFDASSINKKVASIIEGQSTNESNPFLGATNLAMLGSNEVSPAPENFKFSARTPMNIVQNRPFATGRSIYNDTPRPALSGGRRESMRLSSAIRSSTRYSMGLNILVNNKYVDTPSDIASPMSPQSTSIRFPIEPPMSPLPTIETPQSKPDLFAQFCIVDIDPDLISCKRNLERTNTQPTQTVYTFPEKSLPIVDNLHEYCFPNGAILAMVHQADWKRKRHSEYATKFQIMQFTDASNRVYHACCLITTSKITSGNPALIRQLEDLKIATLASNVIKKYIRNYLYRKKNNIKTFIAMQWEENISRSREPSLDPRMSLGSMGGGGNSKTKHVSGLKGFLSGIKNQVMRKKKHHDPAEKIRSNNMYNKPPIKADSHSNTMTSSSNSSNGNNTGTWSLLGGGGAKKQHKQRTWSVASTDSTGTGSTIRPTGTLDAELMPSNGSGSGRAHAASMSHADSGSASRNPVLSPRSMLLAPDTPRMRGNDDMGVSQYTITSVSEVPTPRSTPSEEDDDDDDDDRSAQSHHPPPPRMKSKGKRFFQATPKSTQKRVLIAQKAYCILSDSPLPGLFFRLLRCIALRDSSRNGAQSSRMLNRSQRSLSHDDIYVTDSMCSSYASLAGLHHTVMKDFLLHIQSFDIKRVNHALRKGALNLSYPGYVDHLIINPPIIALEDWSAAVLLRFFPAEVIVHIHALLLLEKSLVVLGSEATFVSIICTAFLHLLKPFKWAGIFVPLLPPLAQEILDAPVPFIVGLCAPALFSKDATHKPKVDISQGTSLLYVDDFELYGKLYQPMPADLNDFRNSITEMEHLLEAEFINAPACRHFEPGGDVETNTMVNLHVGKWKQLVDQVDYQRKRFLHRLMRIYSHQDVHNCTKLIKELLYDTDEELYRPVKKMVSALRHFNDECSGGLVQSSFAWKAVGNVNAASGFYEVDNDRMLQSLRLQTVFEEHFLNTQMFTSFADRCHAEYQEKQRYRQFIGQWLYHRWQRRKRKSWVRLP